MNPQKMLSSVSDKMGSISQGHRRKNWKVRKFTLRDDPAYLHYYDPTKVNARREAPARQHGHVFQLQHFFLPSLRLTDSCQLPRTRPQSDDPLGSIHLRGSVVTAVESVPDGG